MLTRRPFIAATSVALVPNPIPKSRTTTSTAEPLFTEDGLPLLTETTNRSTARPPGLRWLATYGGN